MNFSQFLKENLVRLDGGMGTLLQEKGLLPGELPERWNLSHPDVIREIHKAYFDAGSNVVCTNTFGANLLKYTEDELDAILFAAVENAKKARDASLSPQEKFIALDIGPCGKLLKPLGEMAFEDATYLFRETIRRGEGLGVDLILIETMADSYEAKAALLAAKEVTEKPVLVSCAYGEDGKLMTGATPAAMVALLEGMGADAIGANCSLGPKQLQGVAEELLSFASVPVILKPNAGLPRSENKRTVFDISAEEFAAQVAPLCEKGVRVVGGCCGTTPEYIRALTERIAGLSPKPVEDKNRTVISSYSHAVVFDKKPVLIGERINPTGKKRFQEALRKRDMNTILSEGIAQEEKGAQVLDVNVGIPDVDEVTLLADAVCGLQAVLDLPLQIDTASPEAMEKALRLYNGKALVNSVNGKRESMDAVFPLVKKYGGTVIALTLDENGIPSDAEGRVEIARKILSVAESYGISKKDLIFDPLAMTVSASPTAACVTLEALKRIREELGCHTSLGVSNVSFGLPCRDAINSTFFAMAMENGLSAAIMNPNSEEMMKSYHAFLVLKGMDENCAEYLEAAKHFSLPSPIQKAQTEKESESASTDALGFAIEKGLKEEAARRTAELLLNEEPLFLINERIIPALNKVGEGFEAKKVYLPQLLMSAEAAKSAFAVIKEGAKAETEKNKGPFVLATVKGDIHDIGKNIVRLLLENYGYDVVDLGKDVPPEQIADTVKRLHAPLVGLSALMTTTTPAMEETIRLLRKTAPDCKILVGGAVLTEEFANKIGADRYCKDALEAIRYAESL